jgi:hypothetical protein
MAYMLGFTQMIPTSKLKADSDYMNAMSSVEAKTKNYTVNQLSALANYYQWIILIKKQIANDNLLLLEYMIKVWKYAII